MIVAVAALRTELAFVWGMPRVRTGIGHRARERLTQALKHSTPMEWWFSGSAGRPTRVLCREGWCWPTWYSGMVKR